MLYIVIHSITKRVGAVEKITVEIGTIGKGSSHAREFERTHSIDMDWISDVLEISKKRASSLISSLRHGSVHANVACKITVDLDYQQLARYTARRQVDGLNRYWKYPHVLEFVENQETECDQPLELRPGKRRN